MEEPYTPDAGEAFVPKRHIGGARDDAKLPAISIGFNIGGAEIETHRAQTHVR